ncbi:MAG TPA: phosphotransferase [Chloroflexota bacterium]|nr:phosphotransferase [Chloroflexota bacterium]
MRYDLGTIADVVAIGRSFNDVYRVDPAAGQFVLRISGVRSQAATGVAYELELLRHLAASGIPAAATVATRDGAF